MSAAVARGTVVLVHGLGRTRWSMAPIAWAARRRGYAVVNWGLPDPLFGRWLAAPNDGKVTVASAWLPGLSDFRVVRRGHTFLVLAPEVRAAVFAFLAHGTFDRPTAGAP